MKGAFAVGEIDVVVVSDGHITFTPHEYYQTAAEAWEPHKRWLEADGKLVVPIGCFLVRSGGTTVLIDTGLGPVRRGPYYGGELISSLAAAGVQPEDIDVVFMTHLHADHCGSAALKQGDEMRPAFPRATYRWTSDEQTYWQGDLPAGTFARRDVFNAVASRFVAADGGTSLAPGVDVMALPGHTPGHAGVVLSSGDARAFILGDTMMCPVQLEEPEWSGLFDVDAKLARRTQEALLREAEGSGALIGAAHFPGLTFGRVLSGEGRRYWG